MAAQLQCVAPEASWLTLATCSVQSLLLYLSIAWGAASLLHRTRAPSDIEESKNAQVFAR